MTLDFNGAVGLRLNEHALHTWDIEVALDPSATLPPDASALVIDNLDMIARFSAKPVGVERTVRVRTLDPERRFTIELGADATSLGSGDDSDEADLELPSEAFIRLIYGRLDPDHTPPSARTEHLDELRRAFPGI